MFRKIFQKKKDSASYVDVVVKETGWDKRLVEADMERAVILGMSKERYIKNKCWNMTVVELMEYNKKLDIQLKENGACIQEICDSLGCTQMEAVKCLETASDLGMPMKRFINNKCWTMSAEELSVFNAKCEEQNARNRDKRKTRIDKICEATGWNRKKAAEEMDKAKKMGMPNGKYVYYSGWEFTEEELVEFIELLRQYELKKKEDEEWYINVVIEKTGWTREKAIRMMNIGKTKGFSYKKFITRAVWRKTEEEILQGPEYTNTISESKQKDLDAKQEKALHYRNLMMEEMGWSLGRVRIETFRSMIFCGTSAVEFYLFKVYKNGIEAGKKFITSEINEKMKVRHCDWGGNNYLFENKGIFNQDFKDFVKRRWILTPGPTFEEFRQKMGELDKIIYKPLNGIEGRGIEIYSLDDTEERMREVFEDINAKKPAIIEEFIKQHDEIKEFYPKSVNTIRVMSFLDQGEGRILNAVIKFGTRSNVDNYYQGGIAAGIDEKTGIICTQGVDYEGNLYTNHPYSNKQFKGFKIPHWDKVIELVRVAAAIHKDIPYVGWDISITNDGPEIVEGNHNQGAYLVQYPFAIYNLEGRRHTMEPYLWFDNND